MAKVDPVTGLMNSHAFVESMIDYAMEYNLKGRNYGLIILVNQKQDRVVSTYGQEFSEKVLTAMGQKIVGVTGQTCAVARAKDAYFAVLTYTASKDELEELAKKIEEELNGINEVDGNSITPRMKAAVKLRTDEGITDENMYGEAMKEIE